MTLRGYEKLAAGVNERRDDEARLHAQGLGVLCVDWLPAAGYGSTSCTSAIARPYYSTVDGCALG